MPGEASACRGRLSRPAPASPPATIRNRYLQLPGARQPRAALARTMAAGEVSTAARARAIERRLRTEYGYTLELPPRESRSAHLFPVHA